MTKHCEIFCQNIDVIIDGKKDPSECKYKYINLFTNKYRQKGTKQNNVQLAEDQPARSRQPHHSNFGYIFFSL
jgi:hypothetical protein